MIKVRKELWFGFGLMALIILGVIIMMPWSNITNGHLGLLMLGLVVVAIMLGFPTAFTLMGMGMFFAWIAYRTQNPALATRQVLDLMVQRAYGVMSNDVLIAIPLFVFMGYLVERAALIERLFKSLHLAMARIPGSLAVATIVTCAIFATATGIVGAVVTLMGLLAFPAMLRAGYNIQLSAGAVTAGGCLGILIPPSVLLIVYGATAGVSVVQLYAGAFFPGIMLAALYVGYVIVLAKLKPKLAPPLSAEDRRVALPAFATALAQRGRNALAGLLGAIGGASLGVPKRTVVEAARGHAAAGAGDRRAARRDVAGRDRAGGRGEHRGARRGGRARGGGRRGRADRRDRCGADRGEEAKEGAAPRDLSGRRRPGAEAPQAEPAQPAKPAEKAPAPAERLPTPIWYWIVLATRRRR